MAVAFQTMPKASPLKPTPLGDLGSFVPSPAEPVRVRSRAMPADTHFEPHAHGWAQLAYCASGMVQVTAEQQSQGDDEVTYIVPPSRAVWIAPGARHQITVLEAAEFRTLYIDQSVTPQGWKGCRMLVVSGLLRELIDALDGQADAVPMMRRSLLSTLLLDELSLADTHALGVPMPHPRQGDKRLRALCEAILRSPAERSTLAAWASDVGASERTVARLFRDELGTTYQQWRQQALLAHALPLLARGVSVGQVAALSGYASESAFSAMFRSAMGQTPSHFQRRQRGLA
ncbi:MAG: helix-turn-helix transcriptional regulator [Pseudomonadota bacterium]